MPNFARSKAVPDDELMKMIYKYGHALIRIATSGGLLENSGDFTKYNGGVYPCT